MSKWTRVKQSFERAHEDLYSDNSFTADFYNYDKGDWDPDADTMTNQGRSQIASIQCEIVPPAMDTTVDTDGTSFSWDTSIRFPLEIDDYGGWGNNWGQNWGNVSLTEQIKTLGDDAERPTEVEVTDEADNSSDVYELHGYSVEKGSGMIMCRLVEA